MLVFITKTKTKKKAAETSEGQRNNKAHERALAVRNGRIKLNEVRKRERKKQER